jgi:hypothetical protein
MAHMRLLALAFVAFVALGGGIATGASAAEPVRLGDPPDPRLAARVAAWVTGGGSDDLKALGRDFTELETAATANDLGKMSAGCDHLLADVTAAQQYDPIPDRAVEKDWADALGLYAQGAQDCSDGARQRDVGLIMRASDEIIAGSTDLDKVTARLKTIAGG